MPDVQISVSQLCEPRIVHPNHSVSFVFKTDCNTVIYDDDYHHPDMAHIKYEHLEKLAESVSDAICSNITMSVILEKYRKVIFRVFEKTIKQCKVTALESMNSNLVPVTVAEKLMREKFDDLEFKPFKLEILTDEFFFVINPVISAGEKLSFSVCMALTHKFPTAYTYPGSIGLDLSLRNNKDPVFINDILRAIESDKALTSIFIDAKHKSFTAGINAFTSKDMQCKIDLRSRNNKESPKMSSLNSKGKPVNHEYEENVEELQEPEAFDIFEEAKNKIFNKKIEASDSVSEETATLANSFDATDVKSILSYGRIATLHTDGSVDDLLDKFQGHDMREATKIISEMVARAGDLDMQPLTKADSVLSRIFTFVKTQEERLEDFKQDYSLTSKSFKDLSKRLDSIKTRLVDNVDQLRALFYKNLEQIKMIESHIEALEVRQNAMAATIEECGKMENADFKHEYGVDFSSVANFHRSIHDQVQRKIDSLRLVLVTTRQTSPQLETISKTNVVLACNIQETLDTILPLWKKQFALGIQVVEQQLAGDVTGGIDEMTNKALVDTARLTEMSAIDAANMLNGGKGRVSIEALGVVQNKLLDQIKKTTAIEKGSSDDKLAEQFKRIEGKSTEKRDDESFLNKIS